MYCVIHHVRFTKEVHMSNKADRFEHDPDLVSKVRQLWWTVIALLVISVAAAALPLVF